MSLREECGEERTDTVETGPRAAEDGLGDPNCCVDVTRDDQEEDEYSQADRESLDPSQDHGVTFLRCCRTKV